MCLRPLQNIFFLIVGFMLHQNCYSQSQASINVFYTKKTEKLIDTIESSIAKGRISRFNEMISEEVKNLTYVLKVSHGHSVFQEKKSLKVETSTNPIRSFASSYGGTRGTFFVNPKDSVYLNMREFSGAFFKVKIEPKKWKIHSDEHKYVNKYKCIKATTVDTVVNPKGVFTYIVVAWFSPELPGIYGPAGYFGLPGLILELHNGKMSLEANELDFDTKKEKPFDIDDERGKLVTEKQYDSIVEKTTKDFFNISKF